MEDGLEPFVAACKILIVRPLVNEKPAPGHYCPPCQDERLVTCVLLDSLIWPEFKVEIQEVPYE
jgi:hypothetical protein